MVRKFFPEHKGGWIRIVEAFVAVLLVVGAILILINRGYLVNNDMSSRVYEAQLSIIREIQMDANLRADILDNKTALPIEWEYFNDTNGLTDVKNQILNRTPNYLNCVGKICLVNDVCGLSSYNGKDVYAQSGFIASTSTISVTNAKQIKLFCWSK